MPRAPEQWGGRPRTGALAGPPAAGRRAPIEKISFPFALNHWRKKPARFPQTLPVTSEIDKSEIGNHDPATPAQDARGRLQRCWLKTVTRPQNRRTEIGFAIFASISNQATYWLRSSINDLFSVQAGAGLPDTQRTTRGNYEDRATA